MDTSHRLLVAASPLVAADPPKDVFDRDNLVAWCIVPFDAKKRTPAERVEMLKKLGFKKYAYDWRAEHLPTFDEEVGLLKKAGIELTAVWFPANLGDDAKKLLAVIKKHEVKPQLWVTMGDPPAKEQAEKVEAAAKALRPIAEAAGEARLQGRALQPRRLVRRAGEPDRGHRGARSSRTSASSTTSTTGTTTSTGSPICSRR